MSDFYYLFEQLVCSDHEVAALLERREEQKEKRTQTVLLGRPQAWTSTKTAGRKQTPRRRRTETGEGSAVGV